MHPFFFAIAADPSFIVVHSFGNFCFRPFAIVCVHLRHHRIHEVQPFSLSKRLFLKIWLCKKVPLINFEHNRLLYLFMKLSCLNVYKKVLLHLWTKCWSTSASADIIILTLFKWRLFKYISTLNRFFLLLLEYTKHHHHPTHPFNCNYMIRFFIEFRRESLQTLIIIILGAEESNFHRIHVKLTILIGNMGNGYQINHYRVYSCWWPHFSRNLC